VRVCRLGVERRWNHARDAPTKNEDIMDTLTTPYGREPPSALQRDITNEFKQHARNLPSFAKRKRRILGWATTSPLDQIKSAQTHSELSEYYAQALDEWARVPTFPLCIQTCLSASFLLLMLCHRQLCVATATRRCLPLWLVRGMTKMHL
jgi:hypothetical protein